MKNIKVLHVLYQSLPNISGSSIRSRDILMSQKAVGLDSIAITSPFQKPLKMETEMEMINGIRYYRTYINDERLKISEEKKTFSTKIKKFFTIFSFAQTVYLLAKKENVSIIHAHATFYCGLAAKYASIRIGKPCIYEVRSLWEERRKLITNSNFERIQLFFVTAIETFTMKLATHVIAINKNLYNNLLDRSISEEKISIIPNAVNLEIIKETKTTNKMLNFGYIGSISPIEGLDLLLHSFLLLQKQGIANKLLIYGNGTEFEKLEQLIKELNLKNVKLMGSVSPDKIFQAYKTIDVIVNPRRKSKISDTVTPLKPLEGMGNKKLILASDVGGMKELITHNETGYLFKADSEKDLTQKLRQIINQGTPKEIIENAYKYVKEEKSWFANAKKYQTIYRMILKDVYDKEH